MQIQGFVNVGQENDVRLRQARNSRWYLAFPVAETIAWVDDAGEHTKTQWMRVYVWDEKRAKALYPCIHEGQWLFVQGTAGLLQGTTNGIITIDAKEIKFLEPLTRQNEKEYEEVIDLEAIDV